MKFPNDFVDDDGWARIHQGHGLDRRDLESDLEHNQSRPFVPAVLVADEVHFRYIPRLKWCADYGGCDQEGDWHGHYVAVHPSESSKFTVARWRILRSAVLNDHVRIRYDQDGTPRCECGTEWNIRFGTI